MVLSKYMHLFILQSLMSEIDNYQAQLDLVKSKGTQLIEANQHQPQFVQHIEAQLTNLDDSYLSLQATAMQIKVSGYYPISDFIIGGMFKDVIMNCYDY